MAAAPTPPARSHDPYAALRSREFAVFIAGGVASWMAMSMQSTAVMWDVYERTHDTFAVGLVGLVLVIPAVGFALPGGHAADRYDRKKLMIVTQVASLLCSLGLLASWIFRDAFKLNDETLNANSSVWQRSFHELIPLLTVYICIFGVGAVRAYNSPARTSSLQRIVGRENLANAVSWNSTIYHLTEILGPALAGLLIAITKSASIVYVLDAIGALVCLVSLFMLKSDLRPVEKRAMSMETLLAGARFVWGRKALLGAMALDMFAVLFGGAVALLPIYTKDILHTGPLGLGILRAAPAAGAVVMSIYLAHRRPFERAGRALLVAVVGFGVATIVFGCSHHFGLKPLRESLPFNIDPHLIAPSFIVATLALFATGVFDMISVFVRHTLVQVLTPEEMRGRVSAVNGIFINLSNELGAFESGSVARIFQRAADPAFGPMVSVVSGGIGTIAVVIFIAIFMPDLRKFGRMDVDPDEAKA